jgi:hypothetical protein
MLLKKRDCRIGDTYISVLANPHCLWPRYSQPDSNRWILLGNVSNLNKPKQKKKRKKLETHPNFYVPATYIAQSHFSNPKIEHHDL